MLSFGSWVTFSFQVDRKAGRQLMETAHEAGVNFFDNAEVYAAGESERIMGEVLREDVTGGATPTCVSSKVCSGAAICRRSAG